MNPPLLPETSDKEEPWRAMIDTSSPFSSVQEAVILFEGRSNPPRSQHNASEEVALLEMKYQIAQAEKELIVKERETVDVLKELEMTKKTVKDLKLKLQKEAMYGRETLKIHPVMDYEEHCPEFSENQVDLVDPSTPAKQSLEVDFSRTIDGLTGISTSAQLLKSKIKNEKALLEVTRQNLSANTADVLSLEKHLVDLVDPSTPAKQSLEVDFSRTIDGLTGISTSAQLLKSKIKNEKALLEVTRQNLSANTADVLSLEKHLNQMTLRLQFVGLLNSKLRCSDPFDMSKIIAELNAEMESSKLITETARSEISKLTAELEQTKAKIKSAEIRQHAVKKIEAEAIASEVAALEKIKALSDTDNSNSNIQNTSRVTLPVEDFLVLFRKASQIDKLSRRNIEDNQSKQEAITERTEKSNTSQQSVNEARRKWRLEHVQRLHSLHNNSTKFANRMTNEVTTKSVASEDNNAGQKDDRKPKVTLRQLLNEEKSVRNVCKKFPTKRKKFGVLSLLNWMIKIRRMRRRRLRIRRSMFDFSC